MTTRTVCAQADTIPRPDISELHPVVVAVMDEGIAGGSRPVVVRFRNSDIAGLIRRPKLDGDFVRFIFMPDDVTGTEQKILNGWLDKGFNKILLVGIDMKLYGPLFGAEAHYYGSRAKALTLAVHPVSTDCTDVKGNMVFTSLPDGSEVIATRGRHAAAGRFRHGKTEVYFLPDLRGKDTERWLANFYHWVIGLDVPAAVVELVNKDISARRLGVGTSDLLVSKAGEEIRGVLGVSEFQLQTASGRRVINKRDVASIVFEFNEDRSDKITLKSGENLAGTLVATEFKIFTADGEPRSYNRKNVKMIRFRVPTAETDSSTTEQQTAAP